MSTEQMKAVSQRAWDEMMNQKNLAVVDEIFASNYIWHGPQGAEIRGTEGLKEFLTVYFNAFPDFHVEIEDVIVEGDKIVNRYTYTGTHKGELQGIAPTGKKMSITGIMIGRFSGGKVAENWEIYDELGMLQQLGVIPQE